MFSSNVNSLSFLSFLPSLIAPVSAYPGPVGSLKVMDFVGHPCLLVYVIYQPVTHEITSQRKRKFTFIAPLPLE